MLPEDNTKSYNIAFSINRPHFLFCTVTIYSLLKNNQNNCFFHIYLLHNNCISEADVHCAVNSHPLNKFNNFKIVLADVSILEDLKKLSPIKHWTKEIYFKLFTPILLPNVNKVMHLDTDVLVTKNIINLLNTNIDNYMFAGSCDFKNWLNAGILLINLKKIREHNIQPQIISLLKTNITEEVVIDKIGYKYNINNYIYTLSPRYPIPNNIVTVHFVARKPWLGFSLKAKFSWFFTKIYLGYLKEFIQSKYRLRFLFITLYILSFSMVTRTIIKLLCKKKKPISTKMTISLKKIQKYSIFD